MKQNNSQLVLRADVSQLHKLLEFIEEKLSECACPKKTVAQICVSVEEIFINIANYAYPLKSGECTVHLVTETATHSKGGKATVCISDYGAPFNPLSNENPDISLSAEDREIGGLGIFMVKNNMDTVEYDYTDKKNRLTLSKTW